MIRRISALGALLFLLVHPVGALAAQQQPDPRLLAAEEELAAALIADDDATFERLLLPEFVLRGSPDLDRATWIANALELCWGSQADITDFAVLSLQGDTAIVGLTLTTNQDPDTCDPAIVSSVLTDVWRLDGAAWRLALRHSGPAGGDVTTQFAAEDPPPPLVEGAAELSLVNTGGNTDTQTLGVGGSLTWRPDEWLTEARFAFVRTATESVETAKQVTVAVRQSRAINDRLDVFGRFEFRRNRFAGIARRVTVDAGLGYQVIDRSTHTLRLAAGIGFSNEDRVSSPDVSSAIANLSSDFDWDVTSNATLTEALLVTAALDDGSDYRLSHRLSLTASITRVLSVKLTHELKFVNVPAPGFQKTDTMLSAALVAEF